MFPRFALCARTTTAALSQKLQSSGKRKYDVHSFPPFSGQFLWAPPISVARQREIARVVLYVAKKKRNETGHSSTGQFQANRLQRQLRSRFQSKSSANETESLLFNLSACALGRDVLFPLPLVRNTHRVEPCVTLLCTCVWYDGSEALRCWGESGEGGGRIRTT